MQKCEVSQIIGSYSMGSVTETYGQFESLSTSQSTYHSQYWLSSLHLLEMIHFYLITGYLVFNFDDLDQLPVIWSR